MPSSKPVAITVTLDLVVHVLIKGRTEDDICIGVRRLPEQGSRRSRRPPRSMSSEPVMFISTPCAVDGGLHKRTCDAAMRAASSALPACQPWPTPMWCKAGILHNAGDIGKVKVNEAGVLYEVRRCW